MTLAILCSTRVGVASQAADEAVEGGAMGEAVAKPAQPPDLPVPPEQPDQVVGAAEVEDEAGHVGPPERA